MYKIYADNTLIYDSTIEDYKIGKGSISKETNKSGSFSFTIYTDHFYYDNFVKLKTVITVYKLNKIIFRGRILNDSTDYWNIKTITCEGELGFLQDSIIRPFDFADTPENLFKKFVNEHNAQVDEFKRFKIGTVSIVDNNDYIARSNTEYATTLDNLNERLLESELGGYLYVTHGEDGSEEIPTLNYVSEFTKVSTQKIEFGSNLKNYTKTSKAEEIATAIIPLGATLEREEGESSEEEPPKLTIESVNNGVDYVFDETAVNFRGWVFKVVEWQDVTEPEILKKKAIEYLKSAVNQNVTIELTAIDLQLLDHSIESFNVGDYIHVMSEPHNFNEVLLCNKQTIDLLKPENDTITLGRTYLTFTESTSKGSGAISDVRIAKIESSISSVNNKTAQISKTVTDNKIETDNSIGDIETALNSILEIQNGYISGDVLSALDEIVALQNRYIGGS